VPFTGVTISKEIVKVKKISPAPSGFKYVSDI